MCPRVTKIGGALVATLLLLVAGCASSPPTSPVAEAPPAAESAAPEPAPVATVEIDKWQLGAIGKVSWGTGTLIYQGRRIPFRIGALGVGGVGATRIRATGEVSNMTDIAQFPGVYVQLRAGLTVPGGQLTGPIVLQNTRGVRLRLAPVRTGLALAIGADGVVIEMR